MPSAAMDPIAAERAFVAEVLRGMAALCGDGAPPPTEIGDLTIPLGLSAWIQRAAIGLPDAYEALLGLRRPLLTVSGLEVRHEPVPLRVAEPRAALCSLAGYLFGLVGRAARHAGLTPQELSEAVLGSLEAAAV